MLNEKSLTGHAAVIGAGVMGGSIAALLANIGWQVDLLDRLPDDAPTHPHARNRLAQEGLERALKARPPQFALPEYAARVRVGNVEDHLDWLREADWVVEAVAEDIAVKKSVMAAIAAHVGPQTTVSSNTSGLSLTRMVSECPPDFRARFLGTHFFNPPRYMKLIELTSTSDTDRTLFEGFVRFADRVLGKRVIRAKDTPGFISTRLGMYALARTLEIAFACGLSVEEVDYLTGPLLGRPKSGTFRLADVIGIDITARIVDNLAAALPNDPAYQALRIPEAVRRLIAEGRVGAKAGAGFYKRGENGEILSLDLSTLEYRPRREPTPFPAEIEKLPLEERLRRLWEFSPGHDGGFLQEMLRSTLGYIAAVTPEVADRIVEVDDALIDGFGWEIGPFHMLDALGPVIDWPAGEPQLIARLHESPLSLLPGTRTSGVPGSPGRGVGGEDTAAHTAQNFYYNVDGKHFYFDFHQGRMAFLPRPVGVIVLKDLKKAGKIVEEIDDAALVDLGDDVLCLEWRTKMNTLHPELIAFFETARLRAEEDFAALIIGGSGEHFSAGYDLKRFLARIEMQDWDGLDALLRLFQDALIGFKYATVPVIGTAYGYTLGGGCETMLHCAAAQAAFESAIGLPEANVGLIPAGGGTTQMLLRALEKVPPGTLLEPADPYPALQPLWETLRAGRFSSCADDARQLGFLRPTDGVTRHPDRLLHDAKTRAFTLVTEYTPPPRATATAMGESGLARFRWELHLLRSADKITEHDARVAEKLAHVLTGGALLHPAEVTEQHLLDLEREAFLQLAGTPETLARIKHMLETGKPLRN